LRCLLTLRKWKHAVNVWWNSSSPHMLGVWIYKVEQRVS
jgi:hypothetical protein